jgi:hypothetical protein
VTIQPQSDSTRGDATADGATAATTGGAAAATTDGVINPEITPADTVTPSPLRLLSSVRDESVAAWMIGQVYRRRWDIELYFRWLKTVAQWEHLLSESRNGMLMQFYVAMIGTLLLAACTGRKPDRYSFNLMSLAAAGQGTVQEALAILQRRHAERDRDKKRRAQRRQEKTS